MRATAPHPARARLRRVGISTELQLSQLAQTSQTAISLWLNGRRGLGKNVARRVASLLKVPVETVLFDWSPPFRQPLPKRKRSR